MLTALRYYWITAKGYRLRPWQSPYIRWRMETFFGPQADPPNAGHFFDLMWRERHRLADFLRWTDEYPRDERMVRGASGRKPRNELPPDLLLTFLLTFGPFGYSVLGFPNSQIIGLISWAFSLCLIGRIAWILSREQSVWLRWGVSLSIPLLLLWGLWSPLRKQLPKDQVRVDFKEAKEFTWSFKLVTRRDYSNVRDYFTDLEIPVPEQLLPFTTASDSGSSIGSYTPSGFPSYRWEIEIGSKNLKNRQIITGIYCEEVMAAFLRKAQWGNLEVVETRTGQPFPIGALTRATTMIDIFSTYFNSSFWGKEERASFFAIGPTHILWSIRKQLGSDITDRLVAAALRATADNGEEGQDQDTNIYLYRKLKIADDIINSRDSSKWPQIEAILKSQGVAVDRL